MPVYSINVLLLLQILISTALANQALYLDTDRLAAQVRLDEALDPETTEINVGTYIFRSDNTGIFALALMREVARRGGQARLMMDWLETKLSRHRLTRDQVEYLRAEGLDIRVFGRPRWSDLAHPIQLFRSFNNRMHVKVIVFNRDRAIFGGRNIADDYFFPMRNRKIVERLQHYADREVFVRGELAEKTHEYFMSLWNGPHVDPYADLTSFVPDRAAQDEFAARLDAAMEVIRKLQGRKAWKERVMKLDEARFVADEPGHPEGSRTTQALVEMLSGAKKRAAIVSPYIVLTEELEAAIQVALTRGVEVEVLTAHAASSEVSVFQTAFEADIEKMKAMGVTVWQFRYFKSLHAKIVTVDEDQLYIGSYNFAPRAQLFNIDLGARFRAQKPTENESRDTSRLTQFSGMREKAQRVRQMFGADCVIHLISNTPLVRRFL